MLTAEIYERHLRLHLHMVKQNLEDSNVEAAGLYSTRLDAILGLGEIALCGYVGGHDIKGGQKKMHHYTLPERAEHVLKNMGRIFKQTT